MSNWDDDAHRHSLELVRLTMTAANQGPEPLPEDEVARLAKMIATERQLLIDAMGKLLYDDEPDAGPGVAEFDAGFLYGMMFAQALDETKIALNRIQRAKVLKLVKGEHSRAAGDGGL